MVKILCPVCGAWLVLGIVWKCTHTNDPDLIQEGNIGLIKAARSYNPDKGKFSTYAYLWIKGHMLMELKHRKKHACVSLDKPLADDTDATLGDMLPDKVCVEDDVAEQSYIESVYEELSETNKEILSMILAGKTHSEIAEVMGVKSVQITRRITEIKNRLRGVVV